MSEPLREAVLATIASYKDAALEASRALAKNWLLLIASIGAFALKSFCSALLAPLGMGGGFVLGLVEVALLSCYYSWISEVVRRGKLSVRDFFEFNYGLFICTINTAFILFIATLIIQQLTIGMHAVWVVLCVNLGIFIIFNALPEAIYIHGYNGVQAFSESSRFVRENWIEWYIPLIIFLSPLLLQSPQASLFLLSGANPLLPVLTLIQASIEGLGNYVEFLLPFVSLVVATWFMIFRGFLFKDLESGSRRQRIYRARMK